MNVAMALNHPLKAHSLVQLDYARGFAMKSTTEPVNSLLTTKRTALVHCMLQILLILLEVVILWVELRILIPMIAMNLLIPVL